MAADIAELEDLIPPPRENPDLFGHEAAETKLRAALDGGRMPHAWLVTGPKGIGKATLAFRFARYLFQHPPGRSAAAGGLFAADDIPEAGGGQGLYVHPDLPMFHRVAAGGHGDLLTVELKPNEKTGKMSTQIRVDDVRAAIDFAHMTASEGGYKVIIVDGAESMNRSSENAFLKILEEPPADTVIVLVSHAPGRLLPTTRSRCRTLALKPLSIDIVSTLLDRYLPDATPDEATELARLSEGSIGRALTLAEGSGLETYREIVDILGTLPALDGNRVQRLAAKLGKAGADEAYRAGIDLFRWWLTRIVLAASRGAAGDASLTAAEQDIAARVAATAALPVWLLRLDDSENLIRSADPLNLDRKQVVLSLFLAMA